MKKPRDGQVFRDKGEFWARYDNAEIRAAHNGNLPRWVFDFISIHAPYVEFRSKTEAEGWTMLAPMSIITDMFGGERPDFERDRYNTQANCINAAKRIAKMYGCFVVVIDDIPAKAKKQVVQNSTTERAAA